MPRLTSTIGLDQIDDWFRVGQQATAKPLKSVSSGILNGRYLDPKTKKAYIEPDVNQDPSVAKRYYHIIICFYFLIFPMYIYICIVIRDNVA